MESILPVNKRLETWPLSIGEKGSTVKGPPQRFGASVLPELLRIRPTHCVGFRRYRPRFGVRTPLSPAHSFTSEVEATGD